MVLQILKTSCQTMCVKIQRHPAKFTTKTVTFPKLGKNQILMIMYFLFTTKSHLDETLDDILLGKKS